MIRRIMFPYILTKKKSPIGLSFLIVIFLSVNNFMLAQFVPELIYPHNNEVTKENNITFVWNKDVNQSLNYQFQLSIDATFSSLITDQTTTNNYFPVTSLSNYGQTHYWRVRSSQGAIFSNWSAVRSFLLFTPTSINGLTVWLDPNIGVVLNGANVQSINDNTLNINNAAQVAVSQQPLYVNSDSLINNKCIFRFDGINDFLEIADNSTIDFTNQFSMFVLVKPTIIATNKTIMAKWDYQTQGSWAFQTDFSLPSQLMFAPCFTITDPGNQKVFSTNANMQILTPALVNLMYNGDLAQKVQMYKNTQVLTTSTVNLIPSVLPNSTATLKIGKYGGIATRYYQGDIGEILIYNTELTPSQRSLVNNYLRYKYAPPVSLGPDTLVNPNSFCVNVVLKGQSKYQTYLWSNGSIASSIVATLPGQYWVTVTDFLGNITSDTIIIYNIEIPIPTITGICVNESIIWNADLGPGFTYLWSPNGETTPSISITAAGTYSVQVTDAFLCTKNSGNVNFTLDTYSQTMFLGADTSLCTGNLIALQVGAAETISYLWPNASTGVNYAVGATGNYFVETINGNGCIAQDTMFVTITGQAPLANFAFQNDCFGASSDLTDLSIPIPTDPIAVWSWNMGDGNTLTSQNPSHIYPAPGAYDVELYVESVGGCGAFHTEQIIIYANPIAGFTTTDHCSDQSVQFTNTTLTGSGPITSNYWDFDISSIDSISLFTAPNRIFDLPGNYDVALVVTDVYGCTDSVNITITIDESPIAAFTALNGCANTAIQFVNSSTVGASPTYLWDFGNGTFSIFSNPSKTFSMAGPQTVSLTVTAQNGCINEVVQIIEVFPNPAAQFIEGPHCVGTYMELTDFSTVASGSIDSSLWVINSTDTIYGANAYYLINLMGQNEIVLTTFTNQGCSATLSQFIDVTLELSASFDVGSGVVASGEPLLFANTSIGAGLYLWNFGDGAFSTDTSPLHAFDAIYVDAVMSVMLISMNTIGCIDTAYQSISVENSRLDLELETLFLQKENNLYQVGVRLINVGSLTIAKADLTMYSQNGLLFTETWEGSLFPSAQFIYIFNAKPTSVFSDQDVDDAFICVEGLGYDVNSNVETYLTNNEVCRNIEGENVVMVDISPNPATESIQIQLIVTKNSEVEVGMYDSRGRLVYLVVPSQELTTGLHTYTILLDTIEAGSYYIRLNNGEYVKQEKIIILGM